MNEEFNTCFNLFMILFQGGHNVQHSYPVLVARRGQGRRLPPTPCKPSTLQLKPSNINFPKLNASPTHVRVHLATKKTLRLKCINFFFSFTRKHIIRRHTVFIRCHIHAILYETIEIYIIALGSVIGIENASANDCVIVCEVTIARIKSKLQLLWI